MPDEPAPDSTPLLAFVDTPIFLECSDLATLDFKGLLGADLVHVVVTPLVVDQIERFKDQPREGIAASKRKRAQARLAAIEQALFPTPEPRAPEPVERSPGLYLAWWDELDPQLFKKQRLVWQVEDHVLIGYALTARERGYSVAVVTPDVGARLTAKARGIVAHGIPNEWTEPAPRTDAEAETSEAIGQSRAAPYTKLSLLVAGSKSARLEVPPVLVVNGPEYQARMSTLMPREVTDAEYNARMGFPVKRLDAPASNEISRFNRERDRYLDDLYKESLNQALAHHSLLNRYVPLPLAIANVGTTPADEVTIIVETRRDDVVLASVQPEYPDLPRPPVYARTGDELYMSVAAGLVLEPVRERHPEVSRWRVNATRAEIDVPKVQHKADARPLGGLFLVLPDDDAALRPVSFSYTIHSRQGSQPARGDFQVLLEKGTQPLPFDFLERLSLLAKKYGRKKKE